MIHIMKSRKLFNEGLALSAGFALTTASYALGKNLPLSSLLFFAPFLILLPLTGFAISYFSIQRISVYMQKKTVRVPTSVIIFLHFICLCFLIGLIYAAFVRYKIQYAYLLLPLSIDLSGALVLLSIVRIFDIRKCD